jgi:hypothetical protein
MCSHSPLGLLPPFRLLHKQYSDNALPRSTVQELVQEPVQFLAGHSTLLP